MTLTPLKKKPFPLHHALEVWGLELFMVDISPTLYVAQKMLDLLQVALSHEKQRGVVQEVGCSCLHQSYNLYIRFSVPPTPAVVIKIIGRAIHKFEVLSVHMVNPFTMSPSKEDSCDFKGIDAALAKIKQNESDIIRKVTEGREFSRVEGDDLFTGL